MTRSWPHPSDVVAYQRIYGPRFTVLGGKTIDPEGRILTHGGCDALSGIWVKHLNSGLLFSIKLTLANGQKVIVRKKRQRYVDLVKGADGKPVWPPKLVEMWDDGTPMQDVFADDPGYTPTLLGYRCDGGVRLPPMVDRDMEGDAA